MIFGPEHRLFEKLIMFQKSLPKTLEGLLNMNGVFHEITCKFMKSRANWEIHGIPIKSLKIHKICDFCVTETHETAECTKPYELLLQISGFGAPNHLFREISLFREIPAFPRKTRLARKSIPERETALSRRGGLRECQFGIMFQALKASQTIRGDAFAWLSPPKVVESGGNGTF